MTHFPFPNKLFLFAPVQKRAVRIFSILTACMLVIVFKYWDTYGVNYDMFGFKLWPYYASTRWYRLILCGLTILFAAGIRPRVTGLILVLMLFPILFEPSRQQSRQVMLFTLFCLALLDGGKSSRELPIWPIRLIQIQLSVVYGINVLAKCTPEYLSGDVLIAMSKTLPQFIADMSDGFYHFWILSIPAHIAAKASVLVESFLSLGFWFYPIRWICAIVGIIFHFQLKTIIKIGMLDWVSMFLYLTFLMKFIVQLFEYNLKLMGCNSL